MLSAALLLRHHWQLPDLAVRLEGAVERFLQEEGAIDYGWDTTRQIARGVLQRL